MNEIILDLGTSEFNDGFTGDNESQLWQIDAKDRLIQLLELNLSAAKKYKSKRVNSRCNISSVHNSIYISGKRGSGKTVFLRNTKNIWKEYDKDNEIYFVDVLDPTLLENHDKFSNVLIAQIYNSVEYKIKNSYDLKDKKAAFYTSLKRLADSLGKSCEFSDHTGIDRIMKYSSGVQLEYLFHVFIEKSLDILNCSAIAIPIDDVDMALDRAFEVMDDVRRLLSCPYIIPLVSGDDNLYRQMTNVHFEKEAYQKPQNSDEIIINGQRIAKKLSDEYLTKIFPNQMRLPLESIDRLLPSLKIKFKDSIESPISFYQYQARIFYSFYPYCNGQERSTDWPKPRSARELNQLVHSLQLKYDKKDATFEQWKIFKSWAMQKQDGIAYTNAESFLTCQAEGKNKPFNINDYISFNPRLQSQDDFYWADSDFYKKQLSHLKNITTSNNEYILNSVFHDEYKTLRSMPPLEFYHGNLSITLSVINKEKDNNKNELSVFKAALRGGAFSDLDISEKIKFENEKSSYDKTIHVLKSDSTLLYIYTHADYYNTLSNQTHNVYFSRAFEILFYSFTVKFERKSIVDDLSSIFKRPPFYSIHNVNPTKTFKLDNPDEPEEEFTDGSYRDIVSDLGDTFIHWQECNQHILDLFSSTNLHPLFSALFNKVFTQIHELRINMSKSKSDYDDEHLTDIARRFEHIFINSLASLSKKHIHGEIIQANTALTSTYKTLRNFDDLIKYDRVIAKNTDFDVDLNCVEKKIIDSAWSHPLFILNDCKSTIADNRFKLSIPKVYNLYKNKNKFDRFVKLLIFKIKSETKTASLSEDFIKSWL